MAGQRDESGEGNLIRYQERSDTKGGFFFFFAKRKQQDSCSDWTNWANDKDQGQGLDKKKTQRSLTRDGRRRGCSWC